MTGDFRDASCQENTVEAAKDIANYILTLANNVGIDNSNNILLVPGNHDLTRNFDRRQEVVGQNKREYNPGQGIFKDLDILTDSFEFYKKVIAEFRGNDYAENLFNNVYKVNPILLQFWMR